MTSSSSSGNGNGNSPTPASNAALPAKPDPGSAKPLTGANTPESSPPTSPARPPAVRASASPPGSPSSANAWDPTAAPVPQATIPCPKCGAAVREVARFCQRCHMTMRFECPSCHNKQRTGVACEKCGINFVKYIGAVVAAKHTEQDTIQAKLDRRSAFLKNLVALPLTGGLSLVKQLLRSSRRKS
ncbi:MAG: zinc ribbon domain-containing protein [Candidatus Acidiferrales bacterium]